MKPAKKKSATDTSPEESANLSVSDRDEFAASKLGYKILSIVGHGAMGIVYRARQLDLDRVVALKTVQSDRLDDVTSADRFRREALAVARLQHPAIVQALHYGVVDNVRILAMEYVNGPTCDQWIAREGPMPIRAAWDVIRQTAGGLLHASRHGVLHRDIKPSNLMILPWPDGARSTDGLGVVKIADFGLALLDEMCTPDDRLTGDGHLIGSPAYMAPERFDDNAPADIRSDIYSLGVTLVTLRTGRHPFAKGSLPKLVAQKSRTISTDNPLLRSMPASETMLIVDMLQPEASQRIQNYESLIERLDTMIEEIADDLLVEHSKDWRQKTNLAKSSFDSSGSRTFDAFADDQPPPEVDQSIQSDASNPDHVETVASGSKISRKHSDPPTTTAKWSTRSASRRRVTGVALALVVALTCIAIWNHFPSRVFVVRTHTKPVGGRYLFDGQSLRGFVIGGAMVGSWTPVTNPDGGDVLACLSPHGEITLPIATEFSQQPFRLAVFVQASDDDDHRSATMDLEFDVGNDKTSPRYAVRCRQNQVAIVRKIGRGDELPIALAGPMPQDFTARSRVVHLERQPSGWFVFVEENLIAKLPFLATKQKSELDSRVRFVVDRQGLVADTPAFFISDIQCMSLQRSLPL